MLKRAWDENRQLRALDTESPTDIKIGRNEVYMEKLFDDLSEIMVDTHLVTSDTWRHVLVEHTESVQEEVGQLFQSIFGIPIPRHGEAGINLQDLADDVTANGPDSTIDTLVDVAETAQAHASEHVTPNTPAAVEAWEQAAQAWKGTMESAIFLKGDKTAAGFYKANYKFCLDRANEARVNSDTLSSQPMGDTKTYRAPDPDPRNN
jgi:hypothetical protein